MSMSPREPTSSPHASSDAAEARAAVEQILVAHRDEFLGFARRRVPPNVQADDLLQQVSVRALERAADLRDPEKARAWIYTMLRRVLVDARRTREIPVGEVADAA